MGMNNNIMHIPKGVSLIEVLAALVVLGVGIMGFSALQLKAVEIISTTYARSQAMTIAGDLIERINANAIAWPASYANASHYSNADSNTSNPCIAYSSTNVPDCTAQQMALADIQDIKRLVSEFLFNGSVTVQAHCRDEQVACAIVAWNGTIVENCDPEGFSIARAADNSNANCVIVEFWPQSAPVIAAGGGE
ncbi:MAG: type IV pilus modification protein PilV [Gammaproteobacteria bacterium]|nr:MAG: type IV pilus modification protein PilV [Gammaproteobacteria bacterium]